MLAICLQYACNIFQMYLQHIQHLQLPGEADLDEIEKMQEEAMAGVSVFVNIIVVLVVGVVIIIFVIIIIVLVVISGVIIIRLHHEQGAGTADDGDHGA